MKSRWIWGGLGGVALLALLTVDGPTPSLENPARAAALRQADAIYDAAAATAALTTAAARDLVVSAGLDAFLQVLPLDPDVRARVTARVHSDVFVDEIVPFLLFTKRLYEHHQEADLGFDDHARRAFGGGAAYPGVNHALFQLLPPEPPAAEATGPRSIPSPEVLAKLVELYDAIWLRDGDAEAGLAHTVGCGAADREARDRRLRERASAARPVVRSLLDELASATEGDMHDAVLGVQRDEARQETITLSLIEFVDGEVCKHHRVFASQVARRGQLRTWLHGQLDQPGGGELWTWLASRRGRPRAVHVIVDGLEGNLVEALATGRREVLARASRTLDVPPPRGVPSTPAPAVSRGFLDEFLRQPLTGNTYLPFFRDLYLRQPQGIARFGLSTTPTISVRNLPIAMTGAPVGGPGGTGIPNFHFVDRGYTRDGVVQGRPWYFYGNDALQLTRLTEEAGMRTMFTRLENLDTMACATQYDEAAGFSFDAFLNLAIGEHTRDFGEGLCVAELDLRAQNELELRRREDELLGLRPVLAHRHHPWELYDLRVQSDAKQRAEALVDEIAGLSIRAMPDYLQVYNPWPDHFAHAYGPLSDEVIGPTGELNRLDFWLGWIRDVYTTAGLADQTLYGMAGDHGLVTVRWIVSPEAVVLDALAKEGTPLVVRKISSDEGEGPKLTNRFEPPSMKGVDVVVASTAGGNYMLDLFVDQGEGWARQPVERELRQLRTLGGRTLDLVSELSTRLAGSLDYLVVRTEPCAPDRADLRVERVRDGVVQAASITRRGAHVRVTGDDVLGLALLGDWGVETDADHADAEALRAQCLGVGEDPTTWCTEAQWTALTRATGRPDAVVQLAHLYDTDRAGTINLFPVEGVGYNTKVPGRHAGESFPEKDAFAGVWGPAVLSGPRPDTMVNGAVPELLYGWLTGAPVTPGEDGWGYPLPPLTLGAVGEGAGAATTSR